MDINKLSLKEQITYYQNRAEFIREVRIAFQNDMAALDRAAEEGRE